MKSWKKVLSVASVTLAGVFILGVGTTSTSVQAKTSKVRSSRKAAKHKVIKHKKHLEKVPSADDFAYWEKPHTVVTTQPVTVKEIDVKAFPVYLNRDVISEKVVPAGTKLDVQTSADEDWIVSGSAFPDVHKSFWSVQKDTTNWMKMPSTKNKKTAKKKVKKSRKATKKHVKATKKNNKKVARKVRSIA